MSFILPDYIGDINEEVSSSKTSSSGKRSKSSKNSFLSNKATIFSKGAAPLEFDIDSVKKQWSPR